MRILKYAVSALAVAAVVAAGDDDSNGNGNGNGNGQKNCPKGLNCRKERYVPHPQGMGYPLFPLAQDLVFQSMLANPNPFVLGPLPYSGLEYENGVYSVVIPASNELATLETPLFIRGLARFIAAIWNSQTYFYTGIQPVFYANNVNFPFPSNRVVSAAFNTTRNRNIAMSYAAVRAAEYLLPKSSTVQGIISSFGVDVTYRGASNLADPRDIGNIAAAAMISNAKTDGWNSESTELPIWKHPYSDNYGFVPTNDAYELSHVAQWQPLLETKDDGSFIAQTHITPQIRGANGGYAVTRDQMDTIYKMKNEDLLWKHAGTPDDPLTKEELDLLKSEADIVLQASANLNDVKKSLAAFFDVKVLSFGYMMINSVVDETYGVMKLMALDFGHILTLHDATVVAWNEKIRINAVRPVSAIRYLYGNTNVNAFAGPYQGTKSISGADFNSFLRTMPHADFPSGTSCICAAFTEYLEGFKGTPGKVGLRWDFPPGSNMREPGTVPANWLTVSWENSADFLRDCAYSRVDAGVHFNATVTATLKLCKGLGTQVWNKFKMAAGAIL